MINWLNEHSTRYRLRAAACLSTIAVVSPGLFASPVPTAPQIVAAPVQVLILPTRFPAGVADEAGTTGYIQNDTGGISAIDLATGKTLWQSAEADQPLIVANGRLVALKPTGRNSLHILVLDAQNAGKNPIESDAVTFPDWVSIQTTYGHSFSSGALIQGDDLLLSWDARAWYAGGAAPTPEIQEAARQQASGVARVNLKSGHVDLLPAGAVPFSPHPAGPASPGAIKSQQYWTGSSWETRPFINGSTVSALALETVAAQEKLSLLRWNLKTADPLPTIELLNGHSLWPRVTPNGRYVMIHQALPKESLPAGDYAWWIYSLQDGSLVGKIPFDPSMQDMTILNGRLYAIVQGAPGAGQSPIGFGQHTIPRTLRAVDLKSAQVLWEHPVAGLKVLPPLP